MSLKIIDLTGTPDDICESATESTIENDDVRAKSVIDNEIQIPDEDLSIPPPTKKRKRKRKKKNKIIVLGQFPTKLKKYGAITIGNIASE